MGSLWLITQVSSAVFPAIKALIEAHQVAYLTLVVAIAIIFFAREAYEPASVSFRVPNTDTKVTIRFGDLFKTDDDLLIAVNEFFDGKLGQVVARESVHGGFIEKHFNSDEVRFREEVDRALVGASGTQTNRAISPDVKYPIGTTAVLNIGHRKAFLFALSETNLITAKASTSVPYLWTSLFCALAAVHHHGNGRPLALPLIGNGRSSLNIAPQHLLRLIALILVEFARTAALPKRVTIVLPEACFEALDLREIARDWTQKL